jgi:DNA-binding FrmR family transcriptional regulator
MTFLTEGGGGRYGTPIPYPSLLLFMRQDAKKKTLDAIKRLEGLLGRLRKEVEEDVYCAKILELALAMQGHLKHIQGAVLASHLHTCAQKKLSSPADKDAFITEVIKVVGLSRRS